MRKSSAKIIRKLAGHIDKNATTRRVYRRLKKHYTLLNKNDKTKFMDGAKLILTPELIPPVNNWENANQ